MSQITQSNEYDAIIKSIQRKRKIVVVLTIIAALTTIVACFPTHIEVLGKTIVDYKGINPIVTVFLVLAILFLELVAYVLVSTPLTTSMDIECNPKKHLILNNALNTQKDKSHIYAVDFVYMGKFEEALNYANKMVASNKPAMILIGLFNKARCEFFLGEFDSLKSTVAKYESVLNNTSKINKKAKDVYRKIQKTMNLLIAIADEDKEKISALSSVEVWKNSKATQGYINYLKGIAAYNLNNKTEAIYRLMYVKENCEKIVFAQLSEQYLLKLNNDI